MAPKIGDCLNKNSSNVLCIYIICKSKLYNNNSTKDERKKLAVYCCKVLTLHTRRYNII